MLDFTEWLLTIDHKILLFINGLNSSFFDICMWHISHRFFWLPLYLFLAFMVIYRLGVKKGLLCLLAIGIMIYATDQICSSVIRPMICRIRPSSPDNPISYFLHFVNEYRGNKYGFPSSHAANTFALATFLSLLFKNRRLMIGLTIWAALVSYSRIYLGVHYPTDILVGALIGSGLALLIYHIFTLVVDLKINAFKKIFYINPVRFNK